MTCFINEKKRTRNKHHLFLTLPHHAKIVLAFPSFSSIIPTKKRSSILINRWYTRIFRCKKYSRTREKEGKTLWNRSEKIRKCFWEIFFAFLPRSKEKVLIQFFRSSLARAVKAFHSVLQFFFLIFRSGETIIISFLRRTKKFFFCLKLVWSFEVWIIERKSAAVPRKKMKSSSR